MTKNNFKQMKKIFVILLIFTSLNSIAQNTAIPDSIQLNVDVFQFNEYNSIDTFSIDTAQRNIELFENQSNSLLPTINLGQIGTPSLPIIFSQRTEFEDFMFLNPYNESILRPEKLNYYHTNNPYTDLKYIGASKIKEQQNLSFIHTQTRKTANAGIKYEMTTAKNLATDNENSSVNKMNFWYYKSIKKYNIYTAFYSSKIKRPENGGVVDTPSFEPSNKTYLLNNAKNFISYKGLYINQSYDLNPTYKVRHIFNYSTISRTYFESTPNQNIGLPLLSEEQTYDSTGISSIDNTIDFHLYKSIANLGISYTNKIRTLYYFRGFFYNLSGEFDADNYLTFSASNFNFSKTNGNIIAKYHLTGRKKGDISLISNQSLTFGSSDSSIILSFHENFKNSAPGYFYQHYNGNFDNWNNHFKKIKNLSISGNTNFKKLKLELGGDYRIYQNYTYFNSIAQPTQLQNNLYISTIWAKKTFYLKPFVADINLYWQKSNQQEIINVPEYVAAGSIYADFGIFKNAAHINVGVNLSYTSKYYMYSYRPSTGVFYINNGRLTGNYPIANIFFTAKIRSAIIIVRFDHANAIKYDFTTGILEPSYYSTVENYHLSNFYLRFGVKWWFRN